MGTFKEYVCVEHLDQAVRRNIHNASNKVVSVGFADEPMFIWIEQASFPHEEGYFMYEVPDGHIWAPQCKNCPDPAHYKLTWYVPDAVEA